MSSEPIDGDTHFLSSIYNNTNHDLVHLLPCTHPKPLLQQRQLTDQIGDGIGERLLGTVVWSGLNTYNNLVFQRMRNFIASKEHLGVF